MATFTGGKSETPTTVRASLPNYLDLVPWQEHRISNPLAAEKAVINLHYMELTKEHFDQVTSGLATKEGLAQQTEELKAYAREQTEELARMVNDGFEEVHRRLDVIAQVQQIQHTMERKFAKLEEALHIKL